MGETRDVETRLRDLEEALAGLTTISVAAHCKTVALTEKLRRMAIESRQLAVLLRQADLRVVKDAEHAS